MWCQHQQQQPPPQQQQPEERSSSIGSPAKRGRRRYAEEPQPQLQAWLQQQGLAEAAAEWYARRLVIPFSGSQRAALEGLPAMFEWCRTKGLTGPEAAQVLGYIGGHRRENVVQFATTAALDWQLMDSKIQACIKQLRVAGKRLPKNTSVAGVLRTNTVAAAVALAMPPGHVSAWLEAVGQRFTDAAMGRLLVSGPGVVRGSPAKGAGSD